VDSVRFMIVISILPACPFDEQNSDRCYNDAYLPVLGGEREEYLTNSTAGTRRQLSYFNKSFRMSSSAELWGYSCEKLDR
jgi:hypothetical protein